MDSIDRFLGPLPIDHSSEFYVIIPQPLTKSDIRITGYLEGCNWKFLEFSFHHEVNQRRNEDLVRPTLPKQHADETVVFLPGKLWARHACRWYLTYRDPETGFRRIQMRLKLWYAPFGCSSGDRPRSTEDFTG